MKTFLWVAQCFVFRVPFYTLAFLLGRAVSDLQRGYSQGNQNESFFEIKKRF